MAKRHATSGVACAGGLPSCTAAGTSIRYLFNREGWWTRIVNEVGEETRYEYDSCGLAKKVQLFDGSTRLCRWDAMNRLVGYNDGLGWVEPRRDVIGRVISASYPDGTEEAVEYDQMDYVSSVKGPGGEVRFQRDRLGRTIRESQIFGELAVEVTTRYDALGLPVLVQSSLAPTAGPVSGWPVRGRQRGSSGWNGCAAPSMVIDTTRSVSFSRITWHAGVACALRDAPRMAAPTKAAAQRARGVVVFLMSRCSSLAPRVSSESPSARVPQGGTWACTCAP